MKRVITIIMAFALVCGMSQCKKNIEEITPYYNKVVNITLDASGGAKTNVNPVTGEVTFEDGDEILVGNDGMYVGKLTYSNGTFSGSIVNPSPDDYLHFYHIGNLNADNLVAGGDDYIEVPINDQTVSLPVISYAPSTELYSDDVTAYSAKLRNKCALVKFDVTNASEYSGACITGMNNIVYVDFCENDIGGYMDFGGKITLPSGNGTKWAILMPQQALAAGGEGSAYSGIYTGTRGAIPEIHENDCLSDGIAVTINTLTTPEGAKSGLFSVNPEGKKVRFAQGNLKHIKKKNEWRFHDYQYSQQYTSNFVTGTDYSYNSPVENYGWGTSGFNHGAVSYMPWSTQTVNSNYYAYGSMYKNLNHNTCVADWGYNPIVNGGSAYKQWRTLSRDEWIYVVRERENAAEKRSFGTVTVKSTTYHGMILLPDDWTQPASVDFNADVLAYDANEYTSAQWALMDAAGAVFLPCGGRRHNGSVNGVSTLGYYWSSTSKDATYSYCLAFYDDIIDCERANNRSNGVCVRLVIE